jgi:hypothetical protein
MMSLSNTLLPVPLRPSTARVSPRLTVRLIPFKNLLSSEGLVHVLDGDNRRAAVFLGFSIASSRFDRLCPYLFAQCESLNQWSWEKYENEFHQHDIGQDHEQRGQHHRTGGRTAHALGASPCPHSLKTRDQPNDQAEHSGLKRGRQEIVESPRP